MGSRTERQANVPLVRRPEQITLLVLGAGVLGLVAWMAIGTAGPAVPEPPALRLDPNRATEMELMQLPGIGEKIAQRIVAGRPYESVDELIRVHRIGLKTLSRMRPYLYVAATQKSPGE